MDYSLMNFAEGFYENVKFEQFYRMPFYQPIADALTDRLLGKTTKHLLICAPPRTGKSVFALQCFITWCLGLYPGSRYIIASASSELANQHLGQISAALKTDWYRSFFPFGATIRTGARNKDKLADRSDFLQTAQGGFIKAVGLNGIITGMGAGTKNDGWGGCIICDDLLKEQEFNSETARNRIYKWFHGTIKSRRNSEKTPIILIMQRLHLDDIAGRILQEDDRGSWDLIKIKALDDDNKSFWEETISTDTLLYMRDQSTKLDNYMFYAKYQQEPIAYGNQAVVDADWWKYYTPCSNVIKKYNITLIFWTCDSAYETGENNDESVVQCWGLSHDCKRIFLLDMIHGKWHFNELVSRVKEFVRKGINAFSIGCKIGAIFIENRMSGTALVQQLKSLNIDAKGWLPPKGIMKDKEGRILHSYHLIKQGRVLLPENTYYSRELIAQFLNFSPEGKTHDDIIDATTMALIIWMQIIGYKNIK